MEFDTSIIHLEHVLKQASIKGVEEIVPDLKPIFIQFPAKTSTLTYYMALSTDQEMLDNLVNDSMLGSLMANAILLDQLWFIKVVESLKLQSFLYEIIEYGPTGLSIKLLRTYNDLNDRRDISDEWEMEVFLAVTKKIINLIKDDNLSCAACFYENTSKLSNAIILRISNYFKSSQIADIKKSGDLLFDFLKILESCLNRISNDSDKLSMQQFYKLDSEYCTTDVVNNFKSFQGIIQFLLNNLEEIMKQISVNLWMTWEELDSGNSTIQASIGNKIYALSETIKFGKYNMSESLEQCFKHFQIRPMTEGEEILLASLDTILCKISSASVSSAKKWYGALTKLEEAWKDEKYISFIFTYISFADAPAEIMIRSLEFVTQNCQKLRQEFLNACKKLDYAIQKEILTEICRRQCIEAFFNEQSQQDIIITSNKLTISEDICETLKDLIVLFLQNPLQVINLIFASIVASKENHLKCAVLLDHFHCIWKLNYFSKTGGFKHDKYPFLTVLLQELLKEEMDEKATNNLASFFDMLTSDFAKNFPVSTLAYNITVIMEEELKRDDWGRVHCILTLLNSVNFKAVEPNDVTIYLAFLSQVASTTAWDIESFSKEMVEANKICVSLISKLIEIHFHDTSWLRNVLTAIEETTTTHFCDIWINHGLSFPDNDEFYLKLLVSARSKNKQLINFEDLKEFSREKDIVAFLSFQHLKVITILHRHEWLILFNSCATLLKSLEFESAQATAFQVFSNAMTMLATACDSNTLPCLEFCLGNFSEIFHLMLPSLCDKSFIQVFRNVICPFKRISNSNVKNKCFRLILPIILKSVQNYLDQNRLPNDEHSLSPFVLELDTEWRDDFVSAMQVRV